MSVAIEFIDYIFDRYAFLELSPEASADVIRQAIARRRAEIHPDKLRSKDASILQRADILRELLDSCAKVLLNAELRAAYDVRLQQMRAETPRLVSPSGVPIYDASRVRVNVEGLLADPEADIEGLEQFAASLTGHDEAVLQRARARYAKYPDELDFREALRDALSRKLAYLAGLEDHFWLKAGIQAGSTLNEDTFATSAEHFPEQLERLETRLREDVRGAVTARSGYASLGFTPVLRLAYSGQSHEHAGDNEALVAAATNAFSSRLQSLRDLTARKAEVVAELTTVSRWARLNSVTDSEYRDILLVTSDAPVDEKWPGSEAGHLGVILRIHKATSEGTVTSYSGTVSELANGPNEAIALERNPEISSLLIEATALAETFDGVRGPTSIAPSSDAP